LNALISLSAGLVLWLSGGTVSLKWLETSLSILALKVLRDVSFEVSQRRISLRESVLRFDQLLSCDVHVVDIQSL
jgi:hypothetical protein